ncbi:WD repeat domain-containing protein [Diplocarpon rosae]|nr:WD repeat domain-containing protein [Diplocarpon rosae]
MPYQCMVTCGDALVAARGSSLDSYNLQSGSLLSTWTCPASKESKKEDDSSTQAQKKEEVSNLAPSIAEAVVEETGPPSKKRKLSDEPEKGDQSSAPKDQKPDQRRGKKDKKPKQNYRSVAVSTGLETPAVIALAATTDGRHVIAVTGEDKCIRVFKRIEEGGVEKLQQISERAMPKRPCSVTISQDNTTILSADKFGDVYSLPLIPSHSLPRDPANQNPGTTPASKPFTPAANQFTIHSQRNRKALENQKRHSNQASEKAAPEFEHKLLLGHVSMLTDVAVVAHQGRDYIVTADRDEHIRVSRGIPQAHIIETFCLGHTDFITRLCFPLGREEVLISGGGEDELFVWEWLAGRLVAKLDLKKQVDVVRAGLDVFKEKEVPVETVKIVVSGIRSVKLAVGDGLVDAVVVTCEGYDFHDLVIVQNQTNRSSVPALFTFTLTTENGLEHLQTLLLPGNVLCLVGTTADASDATAGLIVSVDNIHKSGSTSDLRENTTDFLSSLLAYKFQDRSLVENGPIFSQFTDLGDDGAAGRLGNLLYSLENLRKREGQVNEE